MLMTKEIEKRIPRLYATEEIENEDKVVHVKYFSPVNGWTWYGVEYDPEEKLFFGLVEGYEREWGYFSLEEFEEMNRQSLFPVILRDSHFEPKTIKELGLELDS